jgi:outer membrane protein assembly factor BamB
MRVSSAGYRPRSTALTFRRTIIALAAWACGGSDGGPAPNSPTSPTSPTTPTVSPRQLNFFAQGTVGHYYNPPTVVGNAVYIGTSRGFLYAPAASNFFYKLNLNLSKVWEYPLGNKEVRGAAAVDAAGNIYFVVEDGRLLGNNNNSKMSLYSLDNSGVLRWSKAVPQQSISTNVGMMNPAVAADNTVYIGGDKLYAYASDGNLKWSYGSVMVIMNAPIIDPAGNIYFSASGRVVSVSPTGTQRWSAVSSGEFYSSPAFTTDYSRIVVGVGSKILCLSAASGATVWEFSPPGVTGVFRATPAVDNQNNVYIGTKSDSTSVFFAVKSDGTGILWKNAIGNDLYSSPALGNDGTVYVGSEGAKLHALDMATGVEKWNASLLNDDTWSSPAITDNGTLYIGSMDFVGQGGGVYAFRTDATGYQSGAGSPRFHGGNASTGRRE